MYIYIYIYVVSVVEVAPQGAAEDHWSCMAWAPKLYVSLGISRQSLADLCFVGFATCFCSLDVWFKFAGCLCICWRGLLRERKEHIEKKLRKKVMEEG